MSSAVMARPIWRQARRLLRHLRPARGLILLYHRVAAPCRDPQLLCVSPVRFDEHMAILRERFHPMTLADMLEQSRRGSLPRGAVAVTFDDGYVDNLTHAAPLLRKHRVPATIFVTAGLLGQTTAPWWDRLERIALDATIPDAIATAELSALASPPEPNHWDVLDVAVTPRQQLYQQLFAELRPMPVAEREAQLHQLQSLACIGQSKNDPRIMDVDELRQIAADPWVEVGAHTLHHPQLSALPLADQEAEIAGSRQVLETSLGLPVRSFSYPYGSRSAYSQDTVRLVQRLEFTIACANVPGLVDAAHDPYQLPRELVRNWSAQTFQARLMEWFDA